MDHASTRCRRRYACIVNLYAVSLIAFYSFDCFTFAVTECDNLPGISNGGVVQTGTTVDSTATYSCLPGFTLEGLATRTCLANGEWSGQAPTCKRELI